MLIIGGLIIVQVAYLQFFAEDENGMPYSKKAKQVSISKDETMPNRGSILAHDGQLLATSVPSYVLRMDFKAKGMTDSIFKSDVDALAKAMATYFKDKPAAAYKKEMEKARREALSGNGRRVKRIISQKVDYLQLQEIKQFPMYRNGRNVGGLIAEQESRRIYPYQGMAYRTIGYLSAGNSGAGIEKSYDKYLAGIKGMHVVQRTAGGEFIPIDSEENIEPKDGCDVVSTIDVDIQDTAETALRKQLMKGGGYFEAGTIVVMQVNTGEIRAMANMKRNKDGSFGEVYNYAIGAATEPGSTFKLASLIAVLESGNLDINDVIDCGASPEWIYKNHTFRESGSTGLGKASVQKIIEKSSNIGVAKMVIHAFEKKENKFTDLLYKMNLNEKLDIDIDGEAVPYIKNPKKDSKIWSVSSMPQIATGYELKLAPIHTLALYNAIANNGKMVRPKLVNEVRRYGKAEQTFPTQVLKESVCSRKTLTKVRTVLEGVVTNGTAYNAFKGCNYTVAGKTGTAQIAFGNKGYVQNEMKRHQASFCGYFPAEDPQFSCIVVLYTSDIPKNSNFYGGTWAAPVFREIADRIYTTHPTWYIPVIASEGQYADIPELKKGKSDELIEVARKLNMPYMADNIKSDWALASVNGNRKIEIKEQPTITNIIPSVVGMGLKDALFLLEDIGLQVTFSGKGTVRSQSVEAGQKFRKGQNIILTLGN
jgi:cell division protein FtsI (penicillin-binding protein 3)